MAGVQDSQLAIAVSKTGALGSLPCAMLSTDQLESEIRAIQSATDRPFNLNFFCHTPVPTDDHIMARWTERLNPYFKELGVDPDSLPSGGRQPFSPENLALLESYQPAYVSFHFGLPEPDLLAGVKASGAFVLSSATTVAEARWLEAQGADAIIAQGLEAGGHRGHFLSDDLSLQSGLFGLLPQIVEAVSVPVIAAGGIADARSVAAALSLGASAVQVGTAYLLCDEATTSAVHREVLGSEAAAHTAITNVFSGRPARGIVNRLIRELGPLCDDAPPFPSASNAVTALRKVAELQRSGDFSPLWAGQNTRGCKAISAAELTAQLTQTS